MATNITGKFFDQKDFSQRADQALAAVTQKTGFQVEKEIARGTIYSRTKVGSILYSGTYQGSPAVLKLQSLQPETDEATLIEQFAAQNTSQLVRGPKIFVHEPWQAARCYGFMIMEHLTAPRIFKMPFASEEEMHMFARFYQEYRTQAVTQPWMQVLTNDTLAFSVHRVDNWRKISESVGRLSLQDYAPYLMRFYPLAVWHMPSIPMVFSHGHLTANDIYVEENGTFVLLSNIYWSHRPQWYDLAFNVWACWQAIRDPAYTFAQLVEYTEQWLDTYKAMPVVQTDDDFDRKITIMLLERTMGAILTDLGANDFYEVAENQIYLRHLLPLHQQLFDYFERKLLKM